MAGRPRIFDKDQLLTRAVEVFWEKGYESATAEDLLKAMNIGQGSFYLAFKGGKKELYQETLALFSNQRINWFEVNAAKADDKIGFIKTFIKSKLTESEQRRKNGCYLGNCMVELATIDDHTAEIAARLMAKLEKAFDEIISEAQQTGRLKNQTSPKVLAKYLINLRNGLNVTARHEKDMETLEQMLDMALEILY